MIRKFSDFIINEKKSIEDLKEDEFEFSLLMNYIKRIDKFIKENNDNSSYLFKRYTSHYKIIKSEISINKPKKISYYIKVKYLKDMDNIIASLFIDLYPLNKKMDVKLILEYDDKTYSNDIYSAKNINIEDKDGRIVQLIDLINLIDENTWEKV